MYNQLITSFKNAQTAAHAAYAAVVAEEKALLVPQYFQAAKVRSAYSTANELESFCRAVIAGVFARAEREFAPAGAKIDIDQERVVADAGLHRIQRTLESGAVPDVDGLWRRLERQFGGENGRLLAYGQAATALVNGFGLARDPEIKRVGGNIVLTERVWSEQNFRSSRRSPTHSSQESVRRLLNGLKVFADKAGLGALANHLQHWRVHELDFTSREKYSMPGLEIVFFHEYWQYKFAPEVGDDLILFIGEFGAEAMARD